MVTIDVARFEAFLFDLDGVITQTATIHARAWKQLLDELLARQVARTGAALTPFDLETDYRRYVDGKPRMAGLLARIQRGDLETHDRSSPLESLSPRELQVLRLVAEGKTSKDIAVMLDLGLQTVRSYRKTMMKKLGVNNVAGLTQLALAAGITHWNKPDANSLG